MELMIQEIVIRNFRSIEDLKFSLNRNNVLIGMNNSGKTNVLSAVSHAFDFRSIMKEDVFVNNSTEDVLEKEVEIFIKFVPLDEAENPSNTFNDKWFFELGDNISFDSFSNPFFAFASVDKYDFDREQFTNKKYLISKWEEDEILYRKKTVSRTTLENINCSYIDAHRDISSDILNKQSFWSQITRNIQLSADQKSKIEEQLSKINKSIVSSSKLLKDTVNILKKGHFNETEGISLSPVTKDVNTLYTGMNIYFDRKTQDISIPVDFLGQGSKSTLVLSSVEALLSFLYQRNLEKDIPFYSVFLVEEPEAHLHPNAQRSVYKSLERLQGQKMISTHSPYILSQVSLNDLKFIYTDSGKTLLSTIDKDFFSEEEERKIRQSITSSKGDLLFSKLVILAEGETEFEMLNVFFNKFFNSYDSFELGVTIVDVKGSENYRPFIQLLEKAKIDWCILSDGELQVKKSLAKTLKAIFDKERELTDFDNVFVLDNGEENGYSIEDYLIVEGYSNKIKKIINDYNGSAEFINDYINMHHGKPKKGKKTRNYKGPDGEKCAISDYMKENKTKCAKVIAKGLCAGKKSKKMFPAEIFKLLKYVEEVIGGKI